MAREQLVAPERRVRAPPRGDVSTEDGDSSDPPVLSQDGVARVLEAHAGAGVFEFQGLARLSDFVQASLAGARHLLGEELGDVVPEERPGRPAHP